MNERQGERWTESREKRSEMSASQDGSPDPAKIMAVTRATPLGEIALSGEGRAKTCNLGKAATAGTSATHEMTGIVG